jgi:hypothetical protein
MPLFFRGSNAPNYSASRRVLDELPVKNMKTKEELQEFEFLLVCKEDAETEQTLGQKIEFSDFPLDEIKLFWRDGVLMLPSEY